MDVNCNQTMRPPALKWHDSVTRRLCGTWEPSAPMLTEREAVRRGGSARSSEEVPDKGMEPRGCDHGGWIVVPTGNGRSR
jgi:hypothetical protein